MKFFHSIFILLKFCKDGMFLYISYKALIRAVAKPEGAQKAAKRSSEIYQEKLIIYYRVNGHTSQEGSATLVPA